MDTITTISKSRILRPSIDYEALRNEGLRHIEELGSDLWTDFNVHDPGVTILEAVCYAITELGYRSGFNIPDLVTEATGKVSPGQVFFTAKKILTVNPVTINDYRKLLADITGVQNAWLIATETDDVNGITTAINEVPVFLDCVADEYTLVQNDTPVPLSGLYRVLLSLEADDRLGDLNNGDIVIGNPDLPGKYPENSFYFSIELPSWKVADFEFAVLAADNTKIVSAVLSAENNGWHCELTVTGAATSKGFSIRLAKKPATGPLSNNDAQSMFDDKKFVAGIFATYLEKIETARTIVRKAIKTLHEHRNLCEDFLTVTTVDDEQIAFCFDVDVTPATDIEKVQAEIFYAIENYLNPPVAFYTLKELLKKGRTVDEIFDGPILSHGFIDNAQLITTDLRKVLYTSDIISLIMDIEGVTAVRNFMMTKYGEDGKPVPGFISQQWCMPISHMHKPVLRPESSKILLFKSVFPFIPRYDEVRDSIRLLHSIRSREKLSRTQTDIDIPVGIKRNTERYWPVQYDLPFTYGTGEAGLPDGVTNERTAQQRQLKGYLMFFEQLLADFFIQLTNARELFSTNKLTHTYYANFLENIANIDPVYKKDAASQYLLKNIITNPDATTTDKNGWQELYESKDIFQDRRGRFLDHLLSRFAESFNDYALLMYRINYEQGTEERIGFDELTEAKIKTLKEYDEISANRGRAFNYFPQMEQTVGGQTQFIPDPSKYWDTTNVSGLEKKICAITGIKDSSRRFLYCIREIEIKCEEKEVDENGDKVLKCLHSFEVTSRYGIRFISQEFIKKKDAEQARSKVLKTGTDPANYSVFNDGKFRIKLGDLLLGMDEFNSEDEGNNAIKEFAAELKQKCNDPEGLHLIEHILLRPRDDQFDLMEACLDDCDCPCGVDQYSFKASVVLPYWPGHFDNDAFREYFENRIREEAPAQVMIKVCWLNNELMREFEIRYREWIETLAAYTEDKVNNADAFRAANNGMIDILKILHSEYQLATLHNCDESKQGSNTVVLNRTVLGTFKN